jgi:competence protein ComFB
MKDRILMISEDESVREQLLGLLELEYDCTVVESVEKAIEVLEEQDHEIQLMIAELVTEEDGRKIPERLREECFRQNISILIMVPWGKEEDVNSAIRDGAEDILFMPLHPEVLQRRVENLFIIRRVHATHNVMEDLIKEEIDKYIDTLDMCTCSHCRRDLLTLTLNRVSPKYVTSVRGATITKAEKTTSREEKIKLLTDIVYCAQMVKKKPHHER